MVNGLWVGGSVVGGSVVGGFDKTQSEGSSCIATPKGGELLYYKLKITYRDWVFFHKNQLYMIIQTILSVVDEI